MFAVRTSVRENLLDEEQMRRLGITRQSVAEGLRSKLRGWIVEDSRRVIAFSLADRETSSIFALFVTPEFQGLGHGSRLLDAAVDWLWRQGKQCIELSTGARSQAVGFYERRGWRKVELLKSGEWRMALRARWARVRD